MTFTQELNMIMEYVKKLIVKKDNIFHILVAIQPKLAVSSFMGCLKGKSGLMIFERYGNLK